MKCKIEINMDHSSFHPSWRQGLAKVLSSFCDKLSMTHDGNIGTYKLIDVNGVTVGTATIEEED